MFLSKKIEMFLKFFTKDLKTSVNSQENLQIGRSKQNQNKHLTQ